MDLVTGASLRRTQLVSSEKWDAYMERVKNPRAAAENSLPEEWQPPPPKPRPGKTKTKKTTRFRGGKKTIPLRPATGMMTTRAAKRALQVSTMAHLAARPTRERIRSGLTLSHLCYMRLADSTRAKYESSMRYLVEFAEGLKTKVDQQPALWEQTFRVYMSEAERANVPASTVRLRYKALMNHEAAHGRLNASHWIRGDFFRLSFDGLKREQERTGVASDPRYPLEPFMVQQLVKDATAAGLHDIAMGYRLLDATGLRVDHINPGRTMPLRAQDLRNPVTDGAPTPCILARGFKTEKDAHVFVCVFFEHNKNKREGEGESSTQCRTVRPEAQGWSHAGGDV